MSVLVTTRVPAFRGQELFLSRLGTLLRQAPGFVLHAARQEGDDLQLTEIWSTVSDADRFYLSHMLPLVPCDVRPERSYAPLQTLVHGAVQPSSASGTWPATRGAQVHRLAA